MTEPLSLAFFRWLADQADQVQRSHLPHIIRHLRHRQRGPLKWWDGEPSLQCLPVRGRGGIFELVSYRRATNPRSSVYLPDHPHVQERLLELDHRIRLAITDVADVSGSLFEQLRQAKVKSLREAVGPPREVEISGEMGPIDTSLERRLRDLRRERLLTELPKRLEVHHVPSSCLRANWRNALRQIRGVRSAPGLIGIFEFGGHRVPVSLSSCLDRNQQLVWIRSDADTSMAFYEALAEVIFTPDAGPLAAYGLKLAVEIPFSSVERPAATVEEPIGEDITLPAAEPPGTGHGLSEQDLIPRVPSPTPFSRHVISPPGLTVSGADGRKKPKRVARTAILRNSAEEEEQKRQLKEDHYAWHCQACLGKYEVKEVVPPDSYLWSTRHRAPNIAAHHVDHLQNQGALGAWNLLVLCKYHHDALGDALSRERVRSALQHAMPARRHFPTDTDAKNMKSLRGTYRRRKAGY